MVVDASAVLAILFDEPHADPCAEFSDAASTPLRISAVNLAEVLITLRIHRPNEAGELERELSHLRIEYVPSTVAHAIAASDIRVRMGSRLNMGDGFAYALALETRLPLLTTDHGFEGTGISLVFPD